MSLRVLHLVGSPVSEFYAELSRLYAADCWQATADPDRYAFHLAYVSPDGRWRFPADLGSEALAAAPALTAAEAVDRLRGLDLDVVVPQLFCRPGMTTYRSLFDLLGVPYVGNPAEVMALGADKAQAKAVVAAAGVRVPAGEVLRRGEQATRTPPVVVKPVDADNSDGVSLVLDPDEYGRALDLAFGHSDRVLVEDYVELGREVRCGVLELGGELVGLPLEEYAVDPATKPVRLGDDKLGRGGTGDLQLVAKEASRAWILDADDPITATVWDAARRCHRALGCRDYSLFDFRIDPDGQPWFLEAGLYCSFAQRSVLVMMAQAAGIELPELFAILLDQATSRNATNGAVPSDDAVRVCPRGGRVGPPRSTNPGSSSSLAREGAPGPGPDGRRSGSVDRRPPGRPLPG